MVITQAQAFCESRMLDSPQCILRNFIVKGAKMARFYFQRRKDGKFTKLQTDLENLDIQLSSSRKARAGERPTSSLFGEGAVWAIEEGGIAFQGVQVLEQGSRLAVVLPLQPGQNVSQAERQGNDAVVVHSLPTYTTRTMVNKHAREMLWAAT